VINPGLQQFLSLWTLKTDGPQIETPSSWLVPVRRGVTAAMLKVLKPTSDEYNAAALLRYFDGNGAVRIYESHDNAVLMERAGGLRSLTMATTGGDVEAAEILAATVLKLHAPRQTAKPERLTPLNDWFSALYRHQCDAAILGRCAAVARDLLGSERDIGVLHGDLHHDNVLDGGDRGWLAIDPKALLGERAYDVANLLCNPSPYRDIVHDPGRMWHLARLYAGRLELDMQRVLAFAYAHAGLSASWDIEDGSDPEYRLRCAEVLEVAIQGTWRP
jgi:streptomycin 6-kinase